VCYIYKRGQGEGGGGDKAIDSYEANVFRLEPKNEGKKERYPKSSLIALMSEARTPPCAYYIHKNILTYNHPLLFLSFSLSFSLIHTLSH